MNNTGLTKCLSYFHMFSLGKQSPKRFDSI